MINKKLLTQEHYTSHPSGIEPISITSHESFLRGNILKYVLRAPYKGHELEDMEKAEIYLQWELDRLRAQRAQMIKENNQND